MRLDATRRLGSSSVAQQVVRAANGAVKQLSGFEGKAQSRADHARSKPWSPVGRNCHEASVQSPARASLKTSQWRRGSEPLPRPGSVDIKEECPAITKESSGGNPNAQSASGRLHTNDFKKENGAKNGRWRPCRSEC